MPWQIVPTHPDIPTWDRTVSMADSSEFARGDRTGPILRPDVLLTLVLLSSNVLKPSGMAHHCFHNVHFSTLQINSQAPFVIRGLGLFGRNGESRMAGARPVDAGLT